MCDLKLSHPPPIATVPLGTGNNLPFAFGWVGISQNSVLSTWICSYVSLPSQHKCFNPFCFLQGKKNPGTDTTSVESFLDKVLKAKEMKIDKYVHISFSTIISLTLVNNW